MSTLTLALVALVVLGLGYWLYGGYASRLYGVNPQRPTPAKSKADGVDYVPAKNWVVLFGHHFASIAGAAPIIGPVLAVGQWGWLPALLWILLGTVFMGAIHDMGSLMVSIRHGGVSVADVAEDYLGRAARLAFSIFVLLALILVMAVFAVLAAKTIVQSPGVAWPSVGLIPVAVGVGLLMYRTKAPTWIATLVGLVLLGGLVVLGELSSPPVGSGQGAVALWTLGFLVYAFFASVTPVQYLLQPRDYLAAFLLFLGLGLGFVAILVNPRPLAVGAVRLAGSPPIWPMLMVTIACGAISGFHSLIASGTTAKQLATEAHAQRIGYGAMVGEGALATMALVMASAGIYRGNPIAVFSQAYRDTAAPLLGPFGGVFAVLVLNAFILTTLDTATRIGRYIMEELGVVRNRYLASGILVFLAGSLALTGSWKAIWPVFGASNQLVAAMALGVVTAWLVARNKNPLATFVPAVIMFLTTVAALAYQAVAFVRTGSWLLFCAAVVLVALASFMGFRFVVRGLPKAG